MKLEETQELKIPFSVACTRNVSRILEIDINRCALSKVETDFPGLLSTSGNIILLSNLFRLIVKSRHIAGSNNLPTAHCFKDAIPPSIEFCNCIILAVVVKLVSSNSNKLFLEIRSL